MTEKRPSFQELAAEQWAARRFLCVGLDSAWAAVQQLGPPNRPEGALQAQFNCDIIDATADVAGAYKPNSAFYEARGGEGIEDLRATIRYSHQVAPAVPVILDAKRADIGSTNIGYAEFAYDYLDADAITVHPYLGAEALDPFLDRGDRGVFVLCRTSNPGAGEFQDLVDVETNRPLYEVVAEHVARAWNAKGNCGLVVGATYPNELAVVRRRAEAVPILIPGIGVQGGDLLASMKAGLDPRLGGVFLNASRTVIFASRGADYAEAAATEAIRLHKAMQEAHAACASGPTLK